MNTYDFFNFISSFLRTPLTSSTIYTVRPNSSSSTLIALSDLESSQPIFFIKINSPRKALVQFCSFLFSTTVFCCPLIPPIFPIRLFKNNNPRDDGRYDYETIIDSLSQLESKGRILNPSWRTNSFVHSFLYTFRHILSYISFNPRNIFQNIYLLSWSRSNDDILSIEPVIPFIPPPNNNNSDNTHLYITKFKLHPYRIFLNNQKYFSESLTFFFFCSRCLFRRKLPPRCIRKFRISFFFPISKPRFCSLSTFFLPHFSLPHRFHPPRRSSHRHPWHTPTFHRIIRTLIISSHTPMSCRPLAGLPSPQAVPRTSMDLARVLTLLRGSSPCPTPTSTHPHPRPAYPCPTHRPLFLFLTSISPHAAQFLAVVGAITGQRDATPDNILLSLTPTTPAFPVHNGSRPTHSRRLHLLPHLVDTTTAFTHIPYPEWVRYPEPYPAGGAQHANHFFTPILLLLPQVLLLPPLPSIINQIQQWDVLFLRDVALRIFRAVGLGMPLHTHVCTSNISVPVSSEQIAEILITVATRLNLSSLQLQEIALGILYSANRLEHLQTLLREKTTKNLSVFIKGSRFDILNTHFPTLTSLLLECVPPWKKYWKQMVQSTCSIYPGLRCCLRLFREYIKYLNISDTCDFLNVTNEYIMDFYHKSD